MAEFEDFDGRQVPARTDADTATVQPRAVERRDLESAPPTRDEKTLQPAKHQIDVSLCDPQVEDPWIRREHPEAPVVPGLSFGPKHPSRGQDHLVGAIQGLWDLDWIARGQAKDTR